MHPRTSSAHAHPPAPTLRPLPRPTMLPRPPASAQAGATASLGSLLPGEPPPSGSPRRSYLRPSGIRLSGGGPTPASSVGPAAAGGEDAAAAPRSPPPPGFAPLTPGPCARAPGLGLAPRVRPAGSGRAGGADRGSLAAACAPRGQAERAEQNGASGPAPGGNKRGRRWGGRRRAGPGAAGVGTRARELAVLGPRRRAANGRTGGKRNLVVSQ